MKKGEWWIRASVLIALLLTAPVTAQEPEDTVPQQLWQEADRGNWYVRVVSIGNDTLQGRLTYRRGEPRVVRALVPRVLRVERRFESGGGMLIGAAAGFIAGALVGGGMAGNSEGQADVLTGIAGGGGLGMIVGVLVGGLGAPGRVVWTPVWPNGS